MFRAASHCPSANHLEGFMAGEEIHKGEGRGINRRNFLKSAGIVVTGSTLAAGLTPAPESVKAAEAIEAIPTAIMEAANVMKGA
jgi:hypothetical protein